MTKLSNRRVETGLAWTQTLNSKATFQTRRFSSLGSASELIVYESESQSWRKSELFTNTRIGMTGDIWPPIEELKWKFKKRKSNYMDFLFPLHHALQGVDIGFQWLENTELFIHFYFRFLANSCLSLFSTIRTVLASCEPEWMIYELI